MEVPTPHPERTRVGAAHGRLGSWSIHTIMVSTSERRLCDLIVQGVCRPWHGAAEYGPEDHGRNTDVHRARQNRRRRQRKTKNVADDRIGRIECPHRDDQPQGANSTCESTWGAPFR